MILWLALAAAAAPPEDDWSWYDDELFSPAVAAPPALYPGDFDRAPVFHYRVKLPGPPLNSATHAEWSDPVVIGEHILVGSAAGQGLYRLSRRNGGVVQVYPASNSVEAPGTLHDGVVYFADTGGRTYAYTFEGELLWEHSGTAPILGAPTVKGDLVVVNNVDDLAVGLDRATGELQWQYRGRRDLTREAELRLYASPRAVEIDGSVVLGFSSGTLVAVDAETGEERWSRDVGEGRYPDIVAEPVPFGNDLYASGYFEPLVALDQGSQNVRWRLDVGGAYPVIIADPEEGPALVYHGGTDGKLRAINALTGAELWVWDSGTSGALTSPVLTEVGLVVGSSEGGLWIVDPVEGAAVWEWDGDYLLRGLSAIPSVEGRQLVFVTNGGYLYSMLSPEPDLPSPPLWP